MHPRASEISSAENAQSAKALPEKHPISGPGRTDSSQSRNSKPWCRCHRAYGHSTGKCRLLENTATPRRSLEATDILAEFEQGVEGARSVNFRSPHGSEMRSCRTDWRRLSAGKTSQRKAGDCAPQNNQPPIAESQHLGNSPVEALAASRGYSSRAPPFVVLPSVADDSSSSGLIDTGPSYDPWPCQV